MSEERSEAKAVPLSEAIGPYITDRFFLGLGPKEYLRSLLNPVDVVAALIFAVGIPIVVWRFLFGLGAATNLSQDTPWGLWIGFDMLGGVALAAGGYTIAAAVYLFGLKDYHAIVRPAVLTGFLGYLFACIGLLCDLGQPWRIPYPIFYSHGTTSIMFEVGWCVFLYLSVLAFEFSPSAFAWLGLRKVQRQVEGVMIVAIVFGVILSTLHQSSLGSLFLMARDRVHPLWYSPQLPIHFFVSSVLAGLSIVICESALSHRAFSNRLGKSHMDLDALTVGLGKGAAAVSFAYFFLRLIAISEHEKWRLLDTGYGAWLAVELLGFVLLPCILFAWGARNANAKVVRIGGALGVTGIILNRLNVSIFAFNWNHAVRYVPSWMEIVVSITLVTAGVIAFRWIVLRMPVLSESDSSNH
jgi:Ni/Fe-hydrogenase subunit HybB-like protein